MRSQIQTAARFLLARRWSLLTLSVLTPLILLAVVLLCVRSAEAEPLRIESSISGTVVNPDDSTITGTAWVCLGHVHPEGWADWWTCKDSETDGHFSFTGTLPSEFLADYFFVQADAPWDSPHFKSLPEFFLIASTGYVTDLGHIPLTYASFEGLVYEPGGTTLAGDGWVGVYEVIDEKWEEVAAGTYETGTYAVGGVPAGKFLLMAHPPANTLFWHSGPVPVTVTEGSQYNPLATQPISLELTVAQLAVSVETEINVPITANVHLRNEFGDVEEWQWSTPSSPATFGGLNVGETFWIEAWPQWDDVPTWANSASEQVTITTRLLSRTLYLRAPDVVGVVKTPEGTPLPQAYEGEYPIPHPATVHVSNLDNTFEIERVANPAGEFSLALSPDDYVAEAHPFGNLAFTYTKSVREVFSLLGTTLPPELSLDPIRLTYPSVAGWVFHPAGELIPGCLNIWLEDMAGDWVAHEWYCGEKGLPYMLGGVPDGEYWLRTDGLPELGLFPADPEFVYVAPGSQYDPDATQVIHLILQTEPGISGYVRDCDAIPEVRIEGAYVVAHSADWNLEHWDVTDANGEFAIRGVISGTPYILETFPPEDSEYVPLGPITVVPIATGVILEMCMPPTNVVGIVHDYTGAPVHGAGVAVFNDYYWDETSTDELGRFRFRGLPIGEFWVQAGPPWGVQALLNSDPFPIAITQTDTLVDVGAITLPQAFKTVTGHVVFRDTDVGAPDAMVWAHRLDDEGYADQAADPDGGFTLSLSEGEWYLGVEPLQPVTWIFAGPPAWIAFELPITETELITSVRLEVIPTNARVTGQVLCPAGSVVEPCPSDPPHWAIWVEVRNDELANGVELGEDYRFEIPIPDGWYELVVHVDDPEWQGPEPEHIFVGPDETLDVGCLVLLLKDAKITGQVRNILGNGVADVPIVAWQQEGIGWGYAKTDANGYYTMPVVGGEWFVEPQPRDDQPYVFRGQPRLVRAAPIGVMSGVNFVLTWANSHILGIAVDADADHRLHGLDGWTWAELADTLEFFSEAPMRDGGFNLKVSGGYTYNVGVYVPPYASYVSGGRANVPVERCTLGTVITVPLAHKDAVIHGQLIDALTGLPPTEPIWAGVFGEDEEGHWTAVHVDPDSADYEMAVVSGTWHLRAWVDPESGYVAPPTPVDLAVGSSKVIPHNFQVWPINATISGTVYHPSGRPLTTTAFVFAAGESPFVGYFETFARTDENGNFGLRVPTGRYIVGAALPHKELEENEWLNPPPIEDVVVWTGSPATGLALHFRQLDGEITGRVTFTTTASVTPTHPAYVWGWAKSGEWAETEATVVSGTNTFTYSMKVVSDTVWHVGAVYEDWDNGVFYESPEALVPVAPPSGKATRPLTMTGPYTLPQPFIVSFDGGQMQTIVLPDGTMLSIPPGALVVSGTVTLYIFPTQELRPEKGREIIGMGYEMWATDENGQEIAKFNRDVTITFHYPSDAELAKQGLSEYRLIPVYYSTLVGHWILADSYVVDTDNNEITLQVSHFSRWGVASTSGGANVIYLPLILRNYEG